MCIRDRTISLNSSNLFNKYITFKNNINTSTFCSSTSTRIPMRYYGFNTVSYTHLDVYKRQVQVSGTYGATKLLIENLFEDFEQINGSNCAYRIVR